jgi:hypothetical protein
MTHDQGLLAEIAPFPIAACRSSCKCQCEGQNLETDLATWLRVLRQDRRKAVQRRPVAWVYGCGCARGGCDLGDASVRGAVCGQRVVSEQGRVLVVSGRAAGAVLTRTVIQRRIESEGSRTPALPPSWIFEYKTQT